MARSKSTYPYLWIKRTLLKSEAYTDLKFSSRSALLYFFYKGTHKNISKNPKAPEWVMTNNGQIKFTYAEAESFGFSRKTFRAALLDLQVHGFIEVTRRGFGGVGEFKAESEYGLTEAWRTWEKQKGATPPAPSRRASPLRRHPSKEGTDGTD